MHGHISAIWTIAHWEVRRSLKTMSRQVLPMAGVLLILLVLVSGFAARSGVHLQDGMYTIGTDNPEIAGIFAGDERFIVILQDRTLLREHAGSFDVIIINGNAAIAATEKGQSAARTLERDYAKYEAWVYNRQDDLFAAYPLWLDLEQVRSELDFTATESGQYLSMHPRSFREPIPEGPVEQVIEPSPTLDFTKEELRSELQQVGEQNPQFSRYTDILQPESGPENFKTPDQLSPPLPFDSIILIFVFIFPLYFTSQFYMMSIMNERVERKGEILLSTPIPPSHIIIGKALPYFAIMVLVSAILTLANDASLIILLPLIPVIVFFLVNALVIGMVSRSFKELSFISIFFSTVATSYLFFPSIFANVHVISLISPLTLIVLQLQGEGFTAAEYCYSTSLFFLTSIVLFSIATLNFNEERLFGQQRITSRFRLFLDAAILRDHPYFSLFLLSALTIPFVFMVQFMLLVLLFNLPMPFSLVTLLLAAAFVEEGAKSIGLYTLFRSRPDFFTWKVLAFGAFAIALGFLIAEKTLLLVTIAQISESIFGSVLFSSLQVLWLPLSLHFIGIFTTGAILKVGGRAWYLPGLFAATIVHSLYNLYFILGWMA
jgi:ABC-type Na+ efflux pump permease subunit